MRRALDYLAGLALAAAIVVAWALRHPLWGNPADMNDPPEVGGSRERGARC